MKPKNKLQCLVVETDSKLPKITKQQQKYAFEKCLPHFAVATKKGILTCMDCGHKWEDKQILNPKISKTNCPDCNQKLKVDITLKRSFEHKSYYTVISTFEGFQIIRVFIIGAIYKYGQCAKKSVKEIYRNYINSDGKVNTVGNFIVNKWFDSWGGSFELRANNYYIWSNVVFPKIPSIPKLKRNGFKGFLHGLNYNFVFCELLSNSKYETLFKAKMWNVLRYFQDGDIESKKVESYFNTLKICIRNNYKIMDSQIYFDYLDLLKYFGKDLQNAKYVCPENLFKEHDKYVVKKQTIQKKLEVQKLKQRIIEDQKVYDLEKSEFFHLFFTKDNISIEPIKSVKQLYEEADLLSHCAFTKGYHNIQQSLLLSARVNGVIMETIEISLNNLYVKQARGFKNKPSKYHKQIVELVKENMNQIKKCLIKKQADKFSAA